MTTENLQENLDPTVDGATSIWDTRQLQGICFSIDWSGLSVITAKLDLQVSTDQINWDCYGGTQGEVVLNAASGYQIVEVPRVTIPYWRLLYTKNGNTTGAITIRTYGKPMFRNTG